MNNLQNKRKVDSFLQKYKKTSLHPYLRAKYNTLFQFENTKSKNKLIKKAISFFFFNTISEVF